LFFLQSRTEQQDQKIEERRIIEKRERNREMSFCIKIIFPLLCFGCPEPSTIMSTSTKDVSREGCGCTSHCFSSGGRSCFSSV